MKGTIWKKALALALAAVLVTGGVPLQPIAELVGELSLTASAETQTFSGYEFTVLGDHVLEIATTNDLNNLAAAVNNGSNFNGYTFRQTADLTYSATSQWNDTSSTENNFTPIGGNNYFNGLYDGKGRTISGIRIYKPNDKNVGLFGFIRTGSNTNPHGVKNVVLTNSRITGGNQTGGIAGCNDSVIEECVVTDTVCIHAESVANLHGGIAGINDSKYGEATTSKCLSSATLTVASGIQASYFGGLVGKTDDGYMQNNLVIDAVIPDGENIGAVAGYMYAYRLVNNLYINCTVAGTSNASNVGCNGEDCLTNNHRAYGVPPTTYCAVPGYLLTLPENVDSTAAKYVTPTNTYVAARSGQAVTFSYTGELPEGKRAVFSSSAGTMDGDTLTMPEQNVEISFTYGIALYTVTWKNGDTILEEDENVEHGSDPQYDGSTPTKLSDLSYTYTFSGWSPALSPVTSNITYEAQFSKTPYESGHIDQNGDIITIYDAEGWDIFCDCLLNTEVYDGFKGKTVVLDDDIEVTRMAGEDGCDFCGMFYGNGHTLTLDLTATAKYCAPFRFVNGATIAALNTAGTVNAGSYQYGSGLIGQSAGTVNINNCRSSVLVNSTVNGDGTHGGFVGILSNGTLNINNCLFDGTISGSSTTCCGGFVGWRNATLNTKNCLMAGTLAISVDSNSATFSRDNFTPTNSYYRTSYGTVQGTSVGSMTNEQLAAKLGSAWKVSGNDVLPIMDTSILGTAEITDVEQSYIATGSAITITPKLTALDGTVLTEGTHYTSTLTKDGTVVTEVKDPGDYAYSFKAIDGSGYSGTNTFSFTVFVAVPESVKQTAYTETTAVVSWSQASVADSWIIEYSTDSSFENAQSVTSDTKSVTLEGLTNETTYYVRAKAALGEKESAWSSTAVVYTTSKLWLGVDAESENRYIPIDIYYKWSTSQQIYTASELGGRECEITSADFMLISDADRTRNIDIYMVHTDKSEFTSNTDWISVTAADKVFSGSVNFVKNTWTTVTFDNGFLFNGTRNVALIVDDNTGKWYSGSYFRAYDCDKSIALYKGSDSTNFDPISGVTSSGTRIKMKNAVRFTTKNVYTVTLDDSIENGSITADCEKARSGATVTVTPAPDNGYYCTSVTVNGGSVAVTKNNDDGTFSFEMPDENVTVTAEFADTYYVTVTWKNYNGTELEKNENVMGGTVPEYNGETPEKPANDYYTYTFSGWDPTPAAVTQDTEYTAQFTQADRLYTVTWKNYDGTQLEKDEDAKYGDTPEYNGETPEKPEDEYCTYTFAGWTPKVSAVTGEAEYMAAYKAVPKYPVEATTSTNVGSTWSPPYNCYHNDLTPNNTQTLYTSELLQNINGCKICSLKYYVRNGEGECDVTGLKIYMLETDESSLTGIVDVKNNENAVKVFDGDYTFSASGDCVIGLTEPFVYNGGNLIISMESSQAGESGDISFSSDYMDYTASYFHCGTWTDNKHFLPQCTFICADEHKYTVTWKNENGDELEKDENVIGGKMPEYNGSTPTKEQDHQHTYTFDKWSPELSPVRADITYTAQFTESVRLYKITWKNYDDSELETDSVPYGETPRYTGEEPEKPDDDFYNYNFTGWDKEPAEVTGDEEYTAEFTAEPKNQLKHTACDTTEYTTSYAPYYSDYNDYYPNETQTLYSKERLSNIKKGSKIYSLAFYMDDSESVSGPLTVPGMKVYLLETDEEDLNTPADYENDPNAVKVFDSDKTIGSTGLTIDFTTPYTYNGGNLVIVICNSRDGWYRNKVFYGDIGDDNQVYYKQGYNVNYSDIIPKCTFGYVDESYYTVTWKNADGTVLEIDENVPAGSLPKYDSEEPNWLEGRVFQGWKPFVTFVSANTTYTAVYNSVVTFDEDNGNTTTKNVDYGEKVSSYVPEKNGYVFAGWYLSDEMFDFGTEIIQDITLTAHWVSESDAKRLTLGGTYFKGDLINFDNQYFVSEPEAADPANYLEYAVVGDWYRRDDRYYVFNDYKGDEILEITNEYYGDNVDVGFKVVSGDGTEEDPYKFAIVPISPGTKHTVTWLDSDGSTVLAADSVVWGDVPVFNGDIDIPEDKILCWSDGESVYSRDDLPFVKGDITYTAVFAVKLEVGTVFKQGDFVEFGKYCFNADDEDGKVSLAADTGVISVYSVSMISRLKQYKIDDDDNISSFKLYVSCDDVIEGDAAVKVVSGSGTEKDPFIFKMISLGEEENTFKVVYRTDEETLYDVLVKGGEAAPDCAVPGEYAAEGFEGWYLDGEYYDLTTPVTSDIILSSYVWGEAAYTWSADNKTCTAKRVDKADVSHVETETVNAASEVTTPAACESMGKTTYTAEFTHKGFTAQTKVLEDVEALGHDWSAAAYTWSDDNKTCTAERVCRNDASHVEKETVNAVITELDASCEDTGKLIYTAEFASNAFAKQTKEFETTPAAGHKWDAPTYTWSADNKTCTAERVCKNDASHVEKETVKTTSKVTTPATCEYKGITTYTAEFANKAFASQKKELPNVAALGHDWSDTTYTWSDDNKTCTAERVCKNNASHTETETVNTTSEATAAATCESKGKTTYTAEFANKAFAKQTKQLENIEALGHDWNDPTCTWNDDCTEATATFTCKNDSSHVHTEAAAVETTENADGTTTHTAAVTFNGKTYTDTKITGASSADSPDEPGKPDTDKPDTDNSDTDNPDTDSPDTDSPDTDNSDTDNSDTDNSDTDNSDTDNSDTDNSDTDNSDTDNSDTDNSDTDKPNPDKPDPDKPDPEKTGPLGDVNNDGVVDATDALLILRASLGLDTFDDTQSFFGDVDEDGMITSNDALEVLRYSINLPAAEKIGTQAAKKES